MRCDRPVTFLRFADILANWRARIWRRRLNSSFIVLVKECVNNRGVSNYRAVRDMVGKSHFLLRFKMQVVSRTRRGPQYTYPILEKRSQSICFITPSTCRSTFLLLFIRRVFLLLRHLLLILLDFLQLFFSVLDLLLDMFEACLQLFLVAIVHRCLLALLRIILRMCL